MKQIPTSIEFIILVIGCGVAAWLGPWWAPAVVLASWYALLQRPVRHAAIQGGLVLALAYALAAGWMWSQDSTNLLGKTSTLLGGIPPVAMLVVTIVLAWITGLLSGWLGSVLGKTLHEKPAA